MCSLYQMGSLFFLLQLSLIATFGNCSIIPIAGVQPVFQFRKCSIRILQISQFSVTSICSYKCYFSLTFYYFIAKKHFYHFKILILFIAFAVITMFQQTHSTGFRCTIHMEEVSFFSFLVAGVMQIKDCSLLDILIGSTSYAKLHVSMCCLSNSMFYRQQFYSTIFCNAKNSTSPSFMRYLQDKFFQFSPLIFIAKSFTCFSYGLGLPSGHLIPPISCSSF